MERTPTRRRAWLLLLPLLAGCKLVDQRTFNPGAGVPRTLPAPPGPAAPQALVTIDFSRPAPDYDQMLRQAVEQAVARKPDVNFDVVTVVPAAGTLQEQAAAAAALTADARTVARTINSEGVDDDRINLLARAEPGVTTRQVQVFVR